MRAVGTATDGGGLLRLPALAALVLAFCVLYPYLDGAGSCGEPGCPEFSQAHAPVFPELAAGAFVVSIAATAPALAGRLRRRLDPERKPAEVYLSPDPEPPRQPAA
ncbi:MAG: hypothetical protein AB1425_15100 [Actinomycetota bacterium]